MPCSAVTDAEAVTDEVSSPSPGMRSHGRRRRRKVRASATDETQSGNHTAVSSPGLRASVSLPSLTSSPSMEGGLEGSFGAIHGGSKPSPLKLLPGMKSSALPTASPADQQAIDQYVRDALAARALAMGYGGRAQTPLEFKSGTLGGRSLVLARIMPRPFTQMPQSPRADSPGAGGTPSPGFSPATRQRRALNLPSIDSSPKLDARLREKAAKMHAASVASGGAPSPRRSSLGFPLDERGCFILR